MKAQSNIPLPGNIQRWKDSQYIFYFNHKDNGVQEKEKEGSRYEAEFTISNGISQEEIQTALIRNIADPELEKCVVDNIEIEGVKATEIIKPYRITAQMTSKINAIFTATPIKPIDEEPIEENPTEIIKK